MIELGSMGNLVPEWVDIYEEAQEKLKQIRDICICLLLETE